MEMVFNIVINISTAVEMRNFRKEKNEKTNFVKE